MGDKDVTCTHTSHELSGMGTVTWVLRVLQAVPTQLQLKWVFEGRAVKQVLPPTPQDPQGSFGNRTSVPRPQVTPDPPLPGCPPDLNVLRSSQDPSRDCGPLPGYRQVHFPWVSDGPGRTPDYPCLPNWGPREPTFLLDGEQAPTPSAFWGLGQDYCAPPPRDSGSTLVTHRAQKGGS